MYWKASMEAPLSHISPTLTSANEKYGGSTMKIRNALAIIFAFALIAVACGDDDGGNGFSSEIRDSYLEGCETAQTAAFCECTLNELEEKFSEQEFVAFALEQTEDPPEEFMELALACLGEADLGG